MITPQTTLDEIVEKIPGSVKYLKEHGITCIVCGEPVWITLEEAAKEKGFNDEQIKEFVNQLNKMK
ncbi:MAG: DUF1858 domain-containing protein [Bacteroidales bacterium]